jgi:hypothetical protein
MVVCKDKKLPSLRGNYKILELNPLKTSRLLFKHWCFRYELAILRAKKTYAPGILSNQEVYQN